MGKTMTWEKGRQLKSYDNVQFTYNASGIRTSKRVGSFVCNYALDGTRILSETGSYHNLIVVYDNEDSICGIVVNEIPYYFQKNLQGDIIGIVDETGTVVARYTYDAWGACTVVSGSAPIANINPFRYRGYFCDVETGLYYLQSRYYDPTTGRFINADDAQCVFGSSDDFHNSYQYCGNNPISRFDPDGYAWWIVALLTIAVVGSLSGCKSSSKSYSKPKYNTLYDWDPSMKRYNCYAYVLGVTSQMVEPGGIAHKSLRYDIGTIVTNVMADLKKLGYQCKAVSSSYKPKTKETMIAIRTRSDDYHFMKRMSDGSWTHKPGDTAILKLKGKPWDYKEKWYNEAYDGTTWTLYDNCYDSKIKYLKFWKR